MLATLNHLLSRQTKSKAHRHQRVGRACFEALEDRRLLSFSPAVNYATIGTPSAIVTADLNNDGKLDLVTCANAVTGSYSVFLGDGAGGFGAAQRTVMGTQLTSLAVADFNNDGKVDLVVSDNYDYGFDFLAGNGDGTFQPPVYTASGAVAAVGRFNGDSYTDVLIARLGPDWEIQFQVYCGDGQGGFAAVGTDLWYYGSGRTAVDLNNDGKLDVVTAEGYVFPGNGDGTFQFDWEQPALLDGGAIATGDFTGDGKVDAIVAGNNNVSVLRGRGDGTFDAPITQALTGQHTGVATADFNGDGKLDAVVSTYDTAAVRLMLGNGDGTLRDGGAFATGSSPSGVVVGDFNRDGRPDVAVSNAVSRTVSVLLNDGVWGALPPPSLRISDATVTEGNTGSVNAAFTVSLSAASAQPVTVRYASADGTARAGADYQAAGGTLTFAPGETSKAVVVPVLGDRLAEPNETFSVRLIDPANASIADDLALATILDDELRIAIGSASVTEGKSGTKAMTFTVSLSAAYDQAVTVNFATRDGTARAGEDYAARTGTLTFAPGETVKTITISVTADKKHEADETFFVDLFGQSGNALLGAARGTGTIFDDDRR